MTPPPSVWPDQSLDINVDDVVDILAVDDTPANLVALDAVLARPGVNVVRATSGAEALALLEARAFAAVILDAQMPIMDGFEVARRIRGSALRGATPIIFLTAFDVSADEVHRAYASGAVDFVIKPFDAEILRSKVAVFVELFRKSRQAAAAAAKDEFLATLAHELRTPLTSLVVAADSLQRLPVQDPTLIRLHDIIRGQLSHLARLVEDSLEVARFTQGKIVLRPEPIDLRHVVERATQLSHAELEAQGIELVVSLPPDPVPTSADAVRLAQVTANLINNAAKFSNWGGRVAVTLERGEHHAVITVRDWGRGIPPPDLTRIFEPFVQSEVGDTWRGGLGIGLALVKKLVELHGGAVRATSAGSGTGAEFVVTLPLSAAPAVIARADVTAATPKTRTPARVLVVDDNSEVRSAVQLFLQLAGHSVTTVESGRAALAEIARIDPDVVLLDIDLPDLDGYAVAKLVRGARADTRPRLVAMTGNVSAGDQDRALRTGFDAHVSKPIDGRTLIRLMNET
jgi:signal transduction histidine kinase